MSIFQDGIFGDFVSMESGFSGTAKKNAERAGSFAEFLREAKTKKVTLTKDEFMDIAARVCSRGEFVSLMREEGELGMAASYFLMVAPVIGEIAHEIFDKEDNEHETD